MAVRGHLPFILVCTGVYLVVELAFNARLLDVMSGTPTESQVSVIEKTGRFLSGVAAMLALWSTLLSKMRGRGMAVICVYLGVSGAIIITVVYQFEEKLVDHWAEQSTFEDRHRATRLTSLARAAAAGQIRIEGFDRPLLLKPEGKALIALLPVISLAMGSSITEVEAALEKALRAQVVASIGTPEEFYNRVYLNSLREIRDGYNRYVDGVNALNTALDAARANAAASWETYVAELRRRRMAPDKVPWYAQDSVRADLRKRGLNLPNNWRLNDRRTFEATLIGRAELEANSRYVRETEASLGAGASLAKDLSWDQFVAHPVIQSRWHTRLNLPIRRLTPALSLEEFTAEVYQPLLEREIAKRDYVYNSSEASFASNRENEVHGKRAVRALIVPPVALAFSLLGGLVHIAKFSIFLLRFAGVPSFPATFVVAAMVAVLSITASSVENEVTNSSVFLHLSAQAREKSGSTLPFIVTRIVRFQPFFYPGCEAIRRTLMLGATFGYSSN